MLVFLSLYGIVSGVHEPQHVRMQSMPVPMILPLGMLGVVES